VEVTRIPLPSGGAGHVLAQGFIQRPQIILKSVGSRDDDDDVRLRIDVQASNLRIGRDQEVALAPGRRKSNSAQQFQHQLVCVIDCGVRVTACIRRYRGEQRLVAVLPAGVERYEPTIIRQQKCGDGTDDAIRVESPPDEAGRGTHDAELGGDHTAGR
jgi:hypothetical protein